MFVWIVNTNEDDIWLEPSDSWEYFDDLHCDVNIQDTYGEDMMEVDKIVK